MFTFSRSKIAMLAASLTLVASGHALATGQKIRGVVESVDQDAKSITIKAEKTDEVRTYAFPGTPKVDGRKVRDMRSVLEPGQSVILKLKAAEEDKSANLTTGGEILRINSDRNTALVRPVGGGVAREVELPKDITVSGLKPGASIQDLRPGHLVTFKYTAR